MGNMFNNFSRFVDPGRRRPSSRDRRRYEPGYDYDYERRERYYEPEYDMRRSYDREPDIPPRNYDQDLMYDKGREESAATIRELGRERSDLQAQVAELKQQVELLNSLMDAKDKQVKELEEAMENNNTEQINKLVEQINERFNKLERKLDGGISFDSEGFERKMGGRLDDFSSRIEESIRTGTGKNDEMVNVISENVHNESVKCYRNIQVNLDEIQKKLDVVEKKKVSLLGTTACVVVTMLLSVGNLALLVLRILGIV